MGLSPFVSQTYSELNGEDKLISEISNFELRHVLYCDILGFSKYSQSEFFEAEKCFRLFRQLDQMLIDASKHIGEEEPDEISGLIPDYIVRPQAIYCSDSIVISTPATNVDAMWLFEAAARIQNGICAHGFLLRGSIVTGNLYHSGNTIFGPAIAHAVEKDKSGGAPVIVIDHESLKYFSQSSSEEEKEIVRIRKHQLVADDNNESPYIDPFWMSKIHANKETISFHTRENIECWRSLIETGLINKDTDILGKYVWVAKRFNAEICNKASDIKPIVLPTS